MNRLFYLFSMFFLTTNLLAQNVGIGTTTPTNKLSVAGNADVSGSMGIGTTSPVTSAKLDINSTTQGFLPPRLTIVQRSAITNPAIGLVIYCSECDELQVFNGNTWKNMSGLAACVAPILPSVKICNQIWMTANLNVTKYRNGDNIPQVINNHEWNSLTTGAWCWYDNDSASFAATYGKLYNFYAVNDARGLAPQGWHVPTYEEWRTLTDCLGGVDLAGGKMKEAGTTHWYSPNTGADNSSGFSGLPGGIRFGLFDFISLYGYWWTSGAYNNIIMSPYLSYNNAISDRGNYYDTNPVGMSVRCVRD